MANIGIINVSGHLDILSLWSDNSWRAVPLSYRFIRSNHHLVYGYICFKKRFTLESNWSCVFNTFSVLCAHTDISTWTAGERASEERKPSTHTDWRVGSCYTPKWLLHSAQLTLQQGSTAGNTRQAYSVLASVAPCGISVGLSFVFHSLTYKLYFPALCLFLMSNK